MEKMLSTKEAMAALNISRTKLHLLVKAGDIRPLKLGRKVLFPETEVQRFIDVLKRAAKLTE